MMLYSSATALLVTPAGAFAVDDAVLSIATRNTAAIASLLPFTCQVEIDSLVETPIGRVIAGTYWRSTDAVRCRAKIGVTMFDLMSKDGVVHSYSSDTTSREDRGKSGVVSAGRDDPLADVWGHAFFNITDGTFDRRSVEGWVRVSKRSSVKSEVVAGRRLDRIDLSTDNADFVFWLDPALNHLVCRAERTGKGTDRVECVADEFAEVSPGLLFPQSSRLTSFTKDNPGTTGWAAKFTKISAGKPLLPDAFAFRFPPGVVVHDLISKKLARTDSRGNPTLVAKNEKGQELVFSKGPVVPLAPDFSAAPQRATEAEPTSRTAWFLPAGVGLIGAAVVLWLVRRRRRLSDHHSL